MRLIYSLFLGGMIFCITSNFINAQNYGISGFVGFSNVKIGSETSKSFSNSLVNYGLAFNYDMEVFENKSFTFGLSYLKTGYGFKIYDYPDEEKVRANVAIQYLRFSTSFNTMLNFKGKKLTRKPKKCFEFSIGFYTNFKLTSKWDHPRDDGGIEEEVKLNSVSFGFVSGIQFVKNLSNKNELRYFFKYYQDFSNILNHPFDEARLRQYHFGLEYRYQKKKKK